GARFAALVRGVAHIQIARSQIALVFDNLWEVGRELLLNLDGGLVCPYRFSVFSAITKQRAQVVIGGAQVAAILRNQWVFANQFFSERECRPVFAFRLV